MTLCVYPALNVYAHRQVPYDNLDKHVTFECLQKHTGLSPCQVQAPESPPTPVVNYFVALKSFTRDSRAHSPDQCRLCIRAPRLSPFNGKHNQGDP